VGSGGWERDAVILEPCVALEQNGCSLYHGTGYDEDFLARVTSERAKLRRPPGWGSCAPVDMPLATHHPRGRRCGRI